LYAGFLAAAALEPFWGLPGGGATCVFVAATFFVACVAVFFVAVAVFFVIVAVFFVATAFFVAGAAFAFVAPIFVAGVTFLASTGVVDGAEPPLLLVVLASLVFDARVSTIS
jgi:hypothetical protein